MASRESTYRGISTNTHGDTTSDSKSGTGSSYFCFGPRFSDLSGVAAFFRLRKKSPRFGTGISKSLFVFCVFAFAMNHPLDGARLKVVRAQEHLDALKAEIRMYLDEQPHQIIRSEPDGDLHRLSLPVDVLI